jgi:hypothetical protein
MADRLVLVHSPLVGCSVWEPVAADLAGCGYELSMPDLAGAVAAGPPYCLRQAQAIAGGAGGGPAILVGYSGAGPLLAAAGALTSQVQGYVFVDAGLPAPGRSRLEAVPADFAERLRSMAGADGWLPPWPRWWGDEELVRLIPDTAARRDFAAGCPRLPLAMFEEVQPPAPNWPDAPCAYLRLSEAYDDQAALARERGWPVTELDTHHLALLTEPGLVAAALRGLLAELHAGYLPLPADRDRRGGMHDEPGRGR